MKLHRSVCHPQVTQKQNQFSGDKTNRKAALLNFVFFFLPELVRMAGEEGESEECVPTEGGAYKATRSFNCFVPRIPFLCQKS